MSYADDPKMQEFLRRRFPPALVGKLPRTEKRPALDYVGHAAVTDRLNAAEPGWTYTIDEDFAHGGQYWIRGTMTIGGVSRPEYGDGKDPKEALGNFIRRGAMRFGVALDLWSKEELIEASVDVEPVTASSSTEGSEGQSQPGGGKADAEDGGSVPYGEGGTESSSQDAHPGIEHKLGPAGNPDYANQGVKACRIAKCDYMFWPKGVRG